MDIQSTSAAVSTASQQSGTAQTPENTAQIKDDQIDLSVEAPDADVSGKGKVIDLKV